MYKDLAEAIDALHERGFTDVFDVRGNQLHLGDGEHSYNFDDVSLIETVPMDQGTDPGDDRTLVLLETNDGRKGYITLPDGAHVEPDKAALIDHLRAKR